MLHNDYVNLSSTVLVHYISQETLSKERAERVARVTVIVFTAGPLKLAWPAASARHSSC